MRVPEGLDAAPNVVCRLRKSLYGLKQASRQWFARLTSEMLHQGFVQSQYDSSLFLKQASTSFIIAAIYVDDILLTGNNTAGIQSLKSHLHRIFSIKDLGKLHYFLGLEVTHLSDGIALTQKKFTKELLRDCGITEFQKVVTPLPLHLKLHNNSSPLYNNRTEYRCLVGKLNFRTHTRPDLAFTVQALSQYMQNPNEAHYQALQHTLHYIANTSGQGIILNGYDQLSLHAYSDSDWGACMDTRKSVTGYFILLGNSPVNWKSKKQQTVSKSSAEAEYRAMAAVASEITWLVCLLEELGVKNLQPVTLECDNQSALQIAKNPVLHQRTKHIEIDCHFTREKVLEGLIQLRYIPTHEQLADVLTKIIPSIKLQPLLFKLGMFFSTPSLRGDVKHI